MCIHGWQDNANSFDSLIPLLPNDYSYLAIDLPGHGFSSRMPKGAFYRSYDNVGVFLRIKNHFKWPKISVIGHSYGSSNAYLLCGIFPETVDFYIALNNLNPKSHSSVESMVIPGNKIDGSLKYFIHNPIQDIFNTKEELVTKIMSCYKNSLTKQSFEILLERAIEQTDKGFRPRSDCRVENRFFCNYTLSENLNLASNIQCNVLYLKPTNSQLDEEEGNISKIMKAVEKKAKSFEYQTVPGSEYVHLNNPELLAPIISDFMRKITNKMKAK